MARSREVPLARALEARVLFVVDALLYGAFALVTGVLAALHSVTRLRTRHVLVLAALFALLAYEARHWRACAPTVDAQLEGAAVVAASRQCDTRTEHHVLFARCGLDCALPREALAKGRAAAMLECVAARQPLAAYAALLVPLLHPERTHTLEWLQSAAAAAVALAVAGWIVPTVLAWRREERLHGEVHTLVHALNRSSAAQLRAHAPAPAHAPARLGAIRHARGYDGDWRAARPSERRTERRASARIEEIVEA